MHHAEPAPWVPSACTETGERYRYRSATVCAVSAPRRRPLLLPLLLLTDVRCGNPLTKPCCGEGGEGERGRLMDRSEEHVSHDRVSRCRQTDRGKLRGERLQSGGTSGARSAAACTSRTPHSPAPRSLLAPPAPTAPPSLSACSLGQRCARRLCDRLVHVDFRHERASSLQHNGRLMLLIVDILAVVCILMSSAFSRASQFALCCGSVSFSLLVHPPLRRGTRGKNAKSGGRSSGEGGGAIAHDRRAMRTPTPARLRAARTRREAAGRPSIAAR